MVIPSYPFVLSIPAKNLFAGCIIPCPIIRLVVFCNL
jgi:hypothetical protein